MRLIGRISLLCIISVLGFFAGAYANAAYLKWFYPNRLKQQEISIEENIEKTGLEEDTPGMMPSIQTSGTAKQVITCDTVLMVEEYDKNTDITVSHEEDIPGKFMGMNREAFADAMQSYALSPPLSEQKRGLISVEVMSFSRKQVVLRKTYQILEEPSEQVFYLVAEDHYITVYTQDMQEVYLYTDIKVTELPCQLQEEIIQKKLINGEDALYHFLESYSS